MLWDISGHVSLLLSSHGWVEGSFAGLLSEQVTGFFKTGREWSKRVTRS